MAKLLAKLLSMLTPKRRWAQFSLATMFVVTGVICLLLGGLHLLETYGNSLDVEDPKIDAPIRVNARYYCLLGPSECHFKFGFSTADESELKDGCGFVGRSGSNIVQRSWLCYYSMETEFEPIDRPSELYVYFQRFEKPAGQGGGWTRTIKEVFVNVK